MSRGPMRGPGGPRGPRGKLNPKVLARLIKMLFGFYPVLMPVTVLCILFSAAVSAIPAIFVQNVIAVIEKYSYIGDWAAAKAEIVPLVLILVGLYVLSILSIATFNQLMAYITQGFLSKMRRAMFDSMQTLPIKYFDTHKHGDIMSHYTNDIDTLRQLVSQSLPHLLQAGAIVLCVFSIMLYYSIWMTLIVIVGIITISIVTKKVGGGSAKYFMRQQKSIGKAEGFIQEMMNGQKVVKVFCHEDEAVKDFDEINGALFEDSFRAHAYANMLIATVGGLLIASGVPNLSISGLPLTISIAVPFLNMTKQFTGNINQVTQQINSVVMAMAGAERVFSLMDEEPEADNGYVTLVNARVDKDGNVIETKDKTGTWAWKHPHSDGTITYTALKGDVVLDKVDFAYEEGKNVLHDVSVYAEPGQKVAFVGATGAGKTTITNLINRFYDIADGKIRYDGININKIKKSDLRRSLVLCFRM